VRVRKRGVRFPHVTEELLSHADDGEEEEDSREEASPLESGREAQGGPQDEAQVVRASISIRQRCGGNLKPSGSR
jgi:hypothetical protein